MAVVVSVAGLWASALVKSPQQVAAEAAPPKATVLSAVVERRVLKETVILRGTVAPGKSIDVSPSVTGQGKQVVTRAVVKPGQRIRAGAVLIEVSGRPVIALFGRIPAYRDILPGANGPDVEQLQHALRMLGYRVADGAGVFGASTGAAVKRLYQAHGYDAPTGAGGARTAPATGDGTGEQATQDQGGSAERAGAAGPTTSTSRSKPPAKVYLPAGEVVFVSRFPARVTKVMAGLGSEVKGAALTMATGDLMVRGVLSTVDRKLVKAGMRVKILSDESGAEVAGRVASIGEFTSGSAGDAEETGRGDGEGGSGESGSGTGGGRAPAEPGHPVVVKGLRMLPEAFAGQEVRLTIQAAATDGPVLVVPSSAIYAGADGSEQVLKIGPGGRQQRVRVTTGATGSGFVEIDSVGLSEGDHVVVGK